MTSISPLRRSRRRPRRAGGARPARGRDPHGRIQRAERRSCCSRIDRHEPVPAGDRGGRRRALEGEHVRPARATGITAPGGLHAAAGCRGDTQMRLRRPSPAARAAWTSRAIREREPGHASWPSPPGRERF
jgi:hypothetical protein